MGGRKVNKQLSLVVLGIQENANQLIIYPEDRIKIIKIKKFGPCGVHPSEKSLQEIVHVFYST